MTGSVYSFFCHFDGLFDLFSTALFPADSSDAMFMISRHLGKPEHPQNSLPVFDDFLRTIALWHLGHLGTSLDRFSEALRTGLLILHDTGCTEVGSGIFE